MIFTQNQIKHFLNIIDRNLLMYSVGVFGQNILNDEDIALLRGFGINVGDITTDYPDYLQSYYFGRLSGILRDPQTSSLDFNDFNNFMARGQFIQMSKIEEASYEVAKNHSYSHLKRLTTKVKSDVESTIHSVAGLNRKEYESLIKKEISDGVYYRKSVGQVVSEIGHKTGDWERDLGRIVETEMNTILQMGRADEFRRREMGEDPKVYKQVYPLACRHCIKAYTTNGIGSKPRIFTLSGLEANGTNIGKKVADWLPTLGTMHPFCRCQLYSIIPGQVWNEEKGSFEFKEAEELRVKSKIKIRVGDKTFEV